LCIFPEKKNTDRPEGQSVFLVGEDGFPLTGINFDSIFHAKKNTDRPEGQSVFLVGEDGFPLTGINFDSIFRAKKNTNHPKRVIGIFGGGRWIRTIEGIASRFTVCPLWPLGNSPICNFVRRWSW
jgi:hypothetical protein